MTLLQPLCRDRNLQATVDESVGLIRTMGKSTFQLGMGIPMHIPLTISQRICVENYGGD